MFGSSLFPTTCSVKVWSGINSYNGTPISVKAILAHLAQERKKGTSVVFAALNHVQVNQFGKMFLEAGFEKAISYHNVLHTERDPTDRSMDTVIFVAPTLTDEERAEEKKIIKKESGAKGGVNERSSKWYAEQKVQQDRRIEWLAADKKKHGLSGYIPEPCFCDYCHEERAEKTTKKAA